MAAANNQSDGRKVGTGFNTLAVVLLSLAALLFVYALSLFLQGGFLAAQGVDHRAKLDLSGDPALEANLNQQNELLRGQPMWLDQEAGKLSIPIETAKARLIEQLGPGIGEKEAEADHE